MRGCAEGKLEAVARACLRAGSGRLSAVATHLPAPAGLPLGIPKRVRISALKGGGLQIWFCTGIQQGEDVEPTGGDDFDRLMRRLAAKDIRFRRLDGRPEQQTSPFDSKWPLYGAEQRIRS